MSKSVIYAGNSSTQATTVNGVIISFPTISRRYGCNLGINGGNVVTSGEGYYKVIVNLTVDGTADGQANFQVYEDGVAVPFAEASIQTSATSMSNVVIPCEIRNTCCCEKIITVVGSGVVANITNAGILVSKE